ncbi:transporter substrate-binding domain-containing protein [Lacticaseibacillus baoqingensis]|uniref:Transporter substrate-binding domain-containing protein n=1 Tax=Lacticaseibacillus baoqingensis TaxID=2486013 RepID=A0ABW4E623_9LACO|nr:transporter substrate-binding domain-containing protein [Lacticaseibacillus baoqingensis]
MSKRCLFRSVLAVASLLLIGVGLSACGTKTATKTTYKSELVKKNTLTVGLEGVYPPYSYRKDGKLTGFEVELVQQIAKQLDIKVNIKPTKWDGLIAGVGSGRFDFVVDNITATEARKKQYAFSTPYVYSHYILVTKQGSAIKSIDDVKGKRMLAANGSDNAQVAKKFGATIVPNSDFSVDIKMIKDGRADGTVNALSAWQDYQKTNSTAGVSATEIPAAKVAPAQIAALMSKKNPKLRQSVNKALATLRTDGTLKKLSVKYFGTDITEK